MRKLLRRLAYAISQRRREAELAEEIEAHRARRQQRLEESGVPSAEASYASRRDLGNATVAREDSRAVWIWPWIDSSRQDIRHAFRRLVREPGFALTALLTLGLAIGLNTSLFTVFDAVVLRPWPVPDPSRVVMVVDARSLPAFTLAEFDYFVRHARSFSGLAASRCIDGLRDGCVLQLDDRDITADFVNPGYFDTLGIPMARGPGFAAADPAVAVAIVSESAWRARFASDPAIVGREIRLDDVPFTIVGVAANGFEGTFIDRKEIWIPIDAMPLLRPHYLFDDVKRSVLVAGRLAAGVTVGHAEAELGVLSLRFRNEHRLPSHGVRLVATTAAMSPAARRTLYPFFALIWMGVLLVLALACANVGNLLLARAAARRTEIAVRLSLGAARLRLVRQLLTESLVLAAGAAAIGLLVARALPPLVLARLAAPLFVDTRLDAMVLAWTAGFALVTCLAFGLAPALHASRGTVAAALKGQVFVADSRMGLRHVLLAAQVAISVVLLVNAALLVRGLRGLSTAGPGFAIDDVDAVTFQLPASYDTARVRRFTRDLSAGVAAMSGSGGAALANVAPFGRTDRVWTTARIRSRDWTLLDFEVSPSYFDVLRIPIVAGRAMRRGDAERHAVVINEAMARFHWPGESPLGRTFGAGSGPDGAPIVREVVGVVADARLYYGDVALIGPTMFEPIADRVVPEVLVRQPSPGFAAALTRLAIGIEPRVRVRMTPLAENRARLLENSRIGPVVASGLGLVALLLASLGVFSVFAYAVAQRTSEIGIRMALGARPAQITAAVLATSVAPIAGGLAAGLAGAVIASGLLRRFLYGLSPFDPVAYLAATFVLAAAGAMATAIPARRASRIDPAVALRRE